MGKGYYTLKFHTKEDKATAKAHLIWDLPAGSLRLRDWVHFSNPYKESSSLAQVWVRIYYLPVEFWHPEVLSGIGFWLGQSLKIDGNSIDDDVAHFTRILVEIDLAQPLPENMTIDGGDYSFNIEFSYEYFPLFCTRCRITGHSVDKCRRGKKEAKQPEEIVKPKEPEWQVVGKVNDHSLDKSLDAREGLVTVDDYDGEPDEQRQQPSGPDMLQALCKDLRAPGANRFNVLDGMETIDLDDAQGRDELPQAMVAKRDADSDGTLSAQNLEKEMGSPGFAVEGTIGPCEIVQIGQKDKPYDQEVDQAGCSVMENSEIADSSGS
ncbi:uncharacterized protein LOC131022621 [Salvia miltiorrhiza]|uniref:uncharacterized protein LOC131022621 n=1 Tax=Salvia miltiorrhiza TaxID=226208 RepID=UPI0025ACBCF3|nr:uncharacterized protein LOC131022621 [Salvia miltiorrhiza]